MDQRTRDADLHVAGPGHILRLEPESLHSGLSRVEQRTAAVRPSKLRTFPA